MPIREQPRLPNGHYSRKTPGHAQFTPPGRCLVLLAPEALWVTSWPYAKFVLHDWAGAFLCSIFRNESSVLSSEMITTAVAATRWKWPDIPELGMVTFVDARKVRRKREPGRCFRRAGFVPVGTTKASQIALQLMPSDFPPAAPPIGATLTLW